MLPETITNKFWMSKCSSVDLMDVWSTAMSLSELKRTPSRPAAPRVELHKEMQKENNNTLRNCKLNPNKILIAPAARATR